MKLMLSLSKSGERLSHLYGLFTPPREITEPILCYGQHPRQPHHVFGYVKYLQQPFIDNANNYI